MSKESRMSTVPLPDPGWKLVPIQPTQEMLQAAFNLFELPDIDGYPSGNDARRGIFLAMVAAAPEPAEQKASQADSRSDSVYSTERSVSETTGAQALRAAPHELISRLYGQWAASHPNRLMSDCYLAGYKEAERAAQADSRSNQQGEGRCARALAELVALKDLKERADNFPAIRGTAGVWWNDEHQALLAEHGLRLPYAWEEARAAVEALKSDEGDLGVTLRDDSLPTKPPFP